MDSTADTLTNYGCAKTRIAWFRLPGLEATATLTFCRSVGCRRAIPRSASATRTVLAAPGLFCVLPAVSQGVTVSCFLPPFCGGAGRSFRFHGDTAPGRVSLRGTACRFYYREHLPHLHGGTPAFTVLSASAVAICRSGLFCPLLYIDLKPMRCSGTPAPFSPFVDVSSTIALRRSTTNRRPGNSSCGRLYLPVTCHLPLFVWPVPATGGLSPPVLFSCSPILYWKAFVS